MIKLAFFYVPRLIYYIQVINLQTLYNPRKNIYSVQLVIWIYVNLVVTSSFPIDFFRENPWPCYKQVKHLTLSLLAIYFFGLRPRDYIWLINFGLGA